MARNLYPRSLSRSLQATMPSMDDRSKADQSHAYKCGRLARQQGCFRILVIGTPDEQRDWLAGWDAADAELKGGEA